MSNLFDQGFFGLNGYDADAEFIPLITAEEEEHMNKQEFPEELPILPLRNNVLFPEPLGPMSDTISPLAMSRSSAFRTVLVPKLLTTFCIEIKLCVVTRLSFQMCGDVLVQAASR